MNETVINNLEELQNFANDFVKNLKPGDVICLAGDLGAGKTAFVKCIANAYKIQEQLQSPTFNILLTYENEDGLRLNHFDLYRLEQDADLDDIAFYEEIESYAISFIEWAEKFKDAMPEDAIWISIKKINENKRKITINH